MRSWEVIQYKVRVIRVIQYKVTVIKVIYILYIHFKVMITKIMHYKVMVTKVTQYTTVGHHGPFSIKSSEDESKRYNIKEFLFSTILTSFNLAITTFRGAFLRTTSPN